MIWWTIVIVAVFFVGALVGMEIQKFREDETWAEPPIPPSAIRQALERHDREARHFWDRWQQ